MIGRTIAQFLPRGFSVPAAASISPVETSVTMQPDQRRSLLGRDIAFIPQEPLSALNPVLTIGQQMREHLARIGRTPPPSGARRPWKLLNRFTCRTEQSFSTSTRTNSPAACASAS